jgi:hypothetical protein
MLYGDIDGIDVSDDLPILSLMISISLDIVEFMTRVVLSSRSVSYIHAVVSFDQHRNLGLFLTFHQPIHQTFHLSILTMYH